MKQNYRPLIYVCSPYSGDIDRNVVNARRYSRFTLDKGAIPLTPHLLYPQFMDDENPEDRNFAVHTINYVLLGKCDELWVFGDCITEGMKREINLAERRKMKIRYFSGKLKEEFV